MVLMNPTVKIWRPADGKSVRRPAEEYSLWTTIYRCFLSSPPTQPYMFFVTQDSTRSYKPSRSLIFSRLWVACFAIRESWRSLRQTFLFSINKIKSNGPNSFTLFAGRTVMTPLAKFSTISTKRETQSHGKLDVAFRRMQTRKIQSASELFYRTYSRKSLVICTNKQAIVMSTHSLNPNVNLTVIPKQW